MIERALWPKHFSVLENGQLFKSFGIIITEDEWKELKTLIDSFYCQITDDDIREYNDEIYNDLEQSYCGKVSKTTDRPKKNGYIYLVNEVNGPHYKIGKAIDINSRQHIFNVKLPYKIDMAHCFFADDYNEAELKLHNKHKEKRIDGEWFVLDSDDVVDFCSIKEYKNGEFVYDHKGDK
jgi:hypothetical protein